MKRIIALSLSMLLLLCACSSSGTEDIKPPSDVSATGNMTPDSTEDSNGSVATIEETVIFEEDGIKITAKQLDTNALFGPEIKLLIENNTSKNLTFQANNASVNGYMIETMMSVDVASGKKSNDALTFMSSDLEAAGISTIADMEFALYIFDTDSWDEYKTTAPIQLKTSVADTYNYVFDDNGEIVHDGNGVKIIVKGLSENDSIMGPGIIVYVENQNEENLTIQTRNTSVNGFMIESYYSCDVGAGKHAIDSITFLSTELDENGITSIESIDLSFTAFNFETWDTVFDTEIITIDFK